MLVRYFVVCMQSYYMYMSNLLPQLSAANTIRRVGFVRAETSESYLRTRAASKDSDQYAHSLGAIWIAKRRTFLMRTTKTDQTAWVHRLIWLFVGHTCPKVSFLMLLLLFALHGKPAFHGPVSHIWGWRYGFDRNLGRDMVRLLEYLATYPSSLGPVVQN